MNDAGRPASLLIADIDHFKEINDTYGHAAGDRMLEDIGGLITRNLRRSDYAARWGDEEFVIAMAGGNLQQAMLAAEQLRRVVERHDFSDGIKATLSIGVAQCMMQDENWGEALEQADAALYEAKHSGRNRVCMVHGEIEERAPDVAAATKARPVSSGRR